VLRQLSLRYACTSRPRSKAGAVFLDAKNDPGRLKPGRRGTPCPSPARGAKKGAAADSFQSLSNSPPGSLLIVQTSYSDRKLRRLSSDLKLNAIQFRPNTCAPPVDSCGALPMSGRRIVSIMLVYSVAWGVSITPSTNMARADDCLVAPGSATPGRHWFYLTDRATQNKCWHLSGASEVSKKPASEMASQTFQTLIAASSAFTMAAAKNGMSEKDIQTLYAQFLEWKRRTGQ
jgi:hypothetical protein